MMQAAPHHQHIRLLAPQQFATTISTRLINTVAGKVLVGNAEEACCYLGFASGNTGQALLDIQHRFPSCNISPPEHEHHAGPATAASNTLLLVGTPFEQQVWLALRNIAPGSTASYGDIARSIGRASAIRAVASAIGRNPIAILLPCHRIIRSDGQVGGYRWGVDAKRKLLSLEAAGSAETFPCPVTGFF